MLKFKWTENKIQVALNYALNKKGLKIKKKYIDYYKTIQLFFLMEKKIDIVETIDEFDGKLEEIKRTVQSSNDKNNRSNCLVGEELRIYEKYSKDLNSLKNDVIKLEEEISKDFCMKEWIDFSRKSSNVSELNMLLKTLLECAKHKALPKSEIAKISNEYLREKVDIIDKSSIKTSINEGEVDLSSILGLIKDGKLCVPLFQRKYVWSAKKACEFMNSILNGEPFGSIYIWRNGEYNFTDDSNIYIDSSKSKKNADQLIDGQQRLVSIYGLRKAIEVEKTAVLSKIYFSLSSLKFEVFAKNPKNSFLRIPGKHLFLNEQKKEVETGFTSSSDLELSDSLRSVLADTIQSIGHNLLNKTEISCIYIDEASLEKVIKVFGNINTKGVKLNVSDLIRSKWLRGSSKGEEEIDLRKKYEYYNDLNIKNSNRKKIQITEETFYKAIYIQMKSSKKLISSADMIRYNIKKKDKDNLNFFVENIIDAAHFLRANLKIHEDFLPSKVLFLSTVYFISKTNMLKEEKKTKELDLMLMQKRWKQYFLLSCLNNRYVSATNQRLEEDLKNISSIIDKGKSINFAKHDWPKIQKLEEINREFIRNTKLNSSCFILFKSILYSKYREWMTNSKEPKGKIEMHHIIPKKMKSSINNKKGVESLQKCNSILNMTPLTSKDNNKISNYCPEQYLKEFKGNSELESCLKDQGIDYEKLGKINNNSSEKDINDFWDKREELLRDIFICFFKENT